MQLERAGPLPLSQPTRIPLRAESAAPRPVVDGNGETRLRLDWRIQPYDIEGYEAPEME